MKRQHQNFNPLPLLQVLYVKNELEHVLDSCAWVTKKNCLDIAKKFKTTIKRCLVTLNAHAHQSEGKALKITSSVTDLPLPPELSLKLYIHRGNAMIECAWSPEPV